MTREVAKVKRQDTPLCMALPDIDNFKNSTTFRHGAGDAALAHLANVTREVMRPQDTLARYGGEEFVIILPDTTLDNGIEAMTRLQRELTKRFFLVGTERCRSPSAPVVAQLAHGENRATGHQTRRPGHVPGQNAPAKPRLAPGNPHFLKD